MAKKKFAKKRKRQTKPSLKVSKRFGVGDGTRLASSVSQLPMYQDSVAYTAFEELCCLLNFKERESKAPWLRGLDVGFKRVLGQSTRTMSVRVYVDKKLPAKELGDRISIPHHLNGVPVDVLDPELTESVGDLQGTDSIKTKDDPRAGRVGVMVVDVSDEEAGFMFLTAAHVIQMGVPKDERDREARIFPASGNTYVATSLAGKNRNWVRDEHYDCALLGPRKKAGLGHLAGLRGDVRGLRPINVVDRSDVKTDSEVILPLRTENGLQDVRARVVAKNGTYDILNPDKDNSTTPISNHIMVEPLVGQGRKVEPGDSGSLVVDASGRGVGLVRAVSTNNSDNSPGLVAVVPMSWIVGKLKVWPVAKLPD